MTRGTRAGSACIQVSRFARWMRRQAIPDERGVATCGITPPFIPWTSTVRCVTCWILGNVLKESRWADGLWPVPAKVWQQQKGISQRR